MCGKEHKFQALGFRVGWMIGFWKVFCLALHCSTASYWQTTSCLLSDIAKSLNTIITKPSVRIKFVSWGQNFVAHISLHVYLFCWSIENLRSSGGNDQPNEKSKSWLTKWLSSILISLKGAGELVSDGTAPMKACACIFGRELDYFCHWFLHMSCLTSDIRDIVTAFLEQGHGWMVSLVCCRLARFKA